MGEQRGELGGSEFLKTVHGQVRGVPPRVDLERELAVQRIFPALVAERLIESAHDVSDGGLTVTLAECCFDTNGVGVSVDIPAAIGEPWAGAASDAMADEQTLFGESAPIIVVSTAAGAGRRRRRPRRRGRHSRPRHRPHRRLADPHHHRRPRGARADRRRGRDGLGHRDRGADDVAPGRSGLSHELGVGSRQQHNDTWTNSATSVASSASSGTPKRPISPTSASTRCNIADRRARASRASDGQPGAAVAGHGRGQRLLRPGQARRARSATSPSATSATRPPARAGSRTRSRCSSSARTASSASATTATWSTPASCATSWCARARSSSRRPTPRSSSTSTRARRRRRSRARSIEALADVRGAYSLAMITKDQLDRRPRSARLPAARARPSRRRRHRLLGDLRPRPDRRDLRPRRRAGRGRDDLEAGRQVDQAVPAAAAGALRVRARLLRPPRQLRLRPQRQRRAHRVRPPAGARGAGRRRRRRADPGLGRLRRGRLLRGSRTRRCGSA